MSSDNITTNFQRIVCENIKHRGRATVFFDDGKQKTLWALPNGFLFVWLFENMRSPETRLYGIRIAFYIFGWSMYRLLWIWSIIIWRLVKASDNMLCKGFSVMKAMEKISLHALMKHVPSFQQKIKIIFISPQFWSKSCNLSRRH